jgi:hypothetical protein
MDQQPEGAMALDDTNTGGARRQSVWYDAQRDPSEFSAELWKIRRLCTRQGGYAGTRSHDRVQAIILAVDDYAEFTFGNREYFWARPVNRQTARDPDSP